MLSRTPHRQAGITLVEIAITVAIFGILLSAAVPSYQQWIQNMQIRGATESLQSGLQRARTEALKRNQNVTFWLVTSASSKTLDSNCAPAANGTGWVVSRFDPSNKCDLDPSETVTPQIIDKQPVLGNNPRASLDITPDDASSVTFNGLGQIVQKDTPITRIDIQGASSSSDDRKLRLVLASGGMIKLCDPQISASGDSRRC
ncbi:hypothetical protein JHS3_25550 [Jeongeupia sp. HS-3]|uniref:GspH/FimT family pseudopilin n=1 Tax=Jeongeupia sp. HS-3 TaxID=1009682 RepID=UPI0018A64E29|nr:GspH/FimT family pseudopilin [Jeongeupia sp. HS-3]BCL76819.1 hypothetical protein JHS3_25550 [Jeongeupia sp. HS-3]